MDQELRKGSHGIRVKAEFRLLDADERVVFGAEQDRQQAEEAKGAIREACGWNGRGEVFPRAGRFERCWQEYGW